MIKVSLVFKEGPEIHIHRPQATRPAQSRPSPPHQPHTPQTRIVIMRLVSLLRHLRAPGNRDVSLRVLTAQARAW